MIHVYLHLYKKKNIYHNFYYKTNDEKFDANDKVNRDNGIVFLTL